MATTQVIPVVNPQTPAHHQQAILTATKEARQYWDKMIAFHRPLQELLNQATALAHTEKLLQVEGNPAPSCHLCLGKLVVPFGQYQNAPFHSLGANDVGYMKL